MCNLVLDVRCAPCNNQFNSPTGFYKQYIWLNIYLLNLVRCSHVAAGATIPLWSSASIGWLKQKIPQISVGFNFWQFSLLANKYKLKHYDRKSARSSFHCNFISSSYQQHYSSWNVSFLLNNLQSKGKRRGFTVVIAGHRLEVYAFRQQHGISAYSSEQWEN